jgi:DNA repair exonuclease SbcCD ATPase subunit
VQQLRSQLRELQSSAPSMESDNARLRERLKFVQDEVGILRESINVLEPKLARLEPELNLLRSERDGWHTERQQLDAELSRLRPLGRLLMDLSAELQELNNLAARAHNSGSGSAQDSPGASSPAGRPSLFDQGVSLSQRHSLWVGLPSLRALNATLYENIRRLAHDLHTKESHCSELVGKLHHVTTEMETTSRSNETQWQLLTRQQEASAQTIQRLTDLVTSSERELNTLRGHRITVDQIRSVLASYPGKFLEQKLCELLYASAGGNSPSALDDSHFESKRSEPFTPLQKTSPPLRHTAESATSAHSTSSSAARESVEAMLNKVTTICFPSPVWSDKSRLCLVV